MSIATFYQHKKVLITGHTGFKGSWLTLFLHQLGAETLGISLAPKTSEDIFNVAGIEKFCTSYIHDIGDVEFLKQKFKAFQPDIVFHMAAQPLVRYSYQEPLETFQVNVIGTANVLEAVKEVKHKCAVVIITTDKVYHNEEWEYPYRETDALGGKDPYSASKACAELVVKSYRNSFFHPDLIQKHGISIATARAGNVIGGGDWSQDRLIVDIIKSIRVEREIIVRNPEGVRPWQHVLEPLMGYLTLGEELYTKPTEFGVEWNFGPYPDQVLAVEAVVKTAVEILGRGKYKIERDPNAVHEATLLKLDISKTLKQLRWKPKLTTMEAIENTLKWYEVFLANTEASMYDYSMQSIEDYLSRD